MNDLMTKSFLSYVKLKKQAKKDLESDLDIEICLNPTDENNLPHFFLEVESIKADMEEIASPLFDLQILNEETKSTHSTKVLRGLRERMESDTVSILKKAKIVKEGLESLERSNATNRKQQGPCVDRTRISVTSGLKADMLSGDRRLVSVKGIYEKELMGIRG
ncbi:SYP112 protein [Hibiscus syriacus]|uniref:SYP112 protein n=1 Tax=Hibiscus syriacus TaxID=106335 RepID=A0A6A3CYC2_HIBSY|nr:SYP112 protein [Hibiscus syriacus]